MHNPERGSFESLLDAPYSCPGSVPDNYSARSLSNLLRIGQYKVG